MKILIVGCGSIGARHAANARGLADVAVVDADVERARACAAAIGAPSFASIDEGLAWAPRGVVIATPHRTHLAIAHRAVAAGADVLIEKPLSNDESGLVQFLSEVQRAKRQVYVVCNMRFHPGPAMLKEHLTEIGRPLFARAHAGNYLPAMRPGADYRQLYAAKRSEGGGVVLDAIHEIDYLTWLFGPVDSVACQAGRLSTLDIDTEDYAAISLRHLSGVVCTVQLDYLRKTKSRGCEIVGDAGVLAWQSDGKQPERCTVRVYKDSTSEWVSLFTAAGIDTAAPYRALMGEFVRAMEGAGNGRLLTATVAAQELRVALTALRSAAGGNTELEVSDQA